MCHNSQYQDAKKANGSYDFSYVFDDIREHLQSSDITIGNLETTFAGSAKGYSSYPQFNTPEILARNLKDVGLDIVTTANNHSLDTRYFGVESTLNYLDEAGLLHTGTARSIEEQNKPLIYEANGLKLAFLSFTYGTNGIPIPQGKEFCVNLINEKLILKQLEIAKNENPDIICTSMHWGTEYQNTQNKDQEALADFLFQNGVDIIFGSHPHVLQPLEQKKITLPDGTEKNVFVIYSFGNFMSGQTKTNTRTSIILKLNITKHYDTNLLSFDEVSYRPIYTYTSGSYKGYKILDMLKATENYENGNPYINQSTYNLFKSEIERLNNKFHTDIQ